MLGFVINIWKGEIPPYCSYVLDSLLVLQTVFHLSTFPATFVILHLLQAVDSLLNFETVKYFCNEVHESKRYDSALLGYMKVSKNKCNK